MSSVSAIALSGIAADTLKLDASASNLANVEDVSPVGAKSRYRPLGVQASAAPGGGVVAQAVTVKPASLIAYDPTSPLANAQGLVQQPEIDPIAEISNQVAASQAYAFSLDALEQARKNQKALLDLKA